MPTRAGLNCKCVFLAAEVLSGDTPLTIFIPIGSNKTWENAGWPQPLPTAFYPRLVVPTAYKSVSLAHHERYSISKLANVQGFQT